MINVGFKAAWFVVVLWPSVAFPVKMDWTAAFMEVIYLYFKVTDAQVRLIIQLPATAITDTLNSSLITLLHEGLTRSVAESHVS